MCMEAFLRNSAGRKRPRGSAGCAATHLSGSGDTTDPSPDVVLQEEPQQGWKQGWLG